MNVYGYIRVSSQGQLKGDGPERQSRAIMEFCEKHSLTWCGSFDEPGIAGDTEGMDRPGFSEMMQHIVTLSDLPSGKIDAIVVERVDRLARDLMVSELIFRMCREKGIKIFAVDQCGLFDMASDGGDPTRVLIRQIMGALAQWDKSMIVAKMRSARKRKRAAGERCEGAKPYGRTKEEAMVQEVAHQLRDEEKSLSYIANFLNASGFTTRRGKPWTDGSVHFLVKRNKQQH